MDAPKLCSYWKVASLAGKGIKYVASSFGKTIVKAGKKLGEGVTMVAGKAGKAAVDGIKTESHKVKEGVNFVASTAKGFANKIGSLWNKGATTVKTTFLQGNEKIQHASKNINGVQMDPRCRESLCHAWSRKGLRGRTVFSERGLSVYGE